MGASSQGYVEQQDLHSPMATVEEALWFSARLRLDAKLSDDDISHSVQVGRLENKKGWDCINC